MEGVARSEERRKVGARARSCGRLSGASRALASIIGHKSRAKPSASRHAPLARKIRRGSTTVRKIPTLLDRESGYSEDAQFADQRGQARRPARLRWGIITLGRPVFFDLWLTWRAVSSGPRLRTK